MISSQRIAAIARVGIHFVVLEDTESSILLSANVHVCGTAMATFTADGIVFVTLHAAFSVGCFYQV